MYIYMVTGRVDNPDNHRQQSCCRHFSAAKQACLIRLDYQISMSSHDHTKKYGHGYTFLQR